MRYAINTVDGSVLVMAVLPVAVTIDGKRFLVLRVKPNELQLEERAPLPLPVAPFELEPNSIPGVELEFPRPEDEVAKWLPEERSKVVGHHPIKAADLPDRAYRNAWTLGADKKIGHDMGRARNIHRDKMREARAAKMVALDVDYMRADETGRTSDKVKIAAAKQALRDVTALPEIDAAKTIADLKAVWPAALT